MSLKVGDEVLYEVVSGDLLCTVVHIGPRLIQIQLPEGQRRLVARRSILRLDDYQTDNHACVKP